MSASITVTHMKDCMEDIPRGSVVDGLHVIMMSYCGTRDAACIIKADHLSSAHSGRSRARIPAGLEAELLYCICIVFAYVCCYVRSLADSLHDSQAARATAYTLATR